MLIPDLKRLAHETDRPDARDLDQLRELSVLLRTRGAKDLACGLEAAMRLVEAAGVPSERLDRESIAATAGRLLELLAEPVSKIAAPPAKKEKPESPPPQPAPSRQLPVAKKVRRRARAPAPPPQPPVEKALGEIMVELGHVTPAQVHAALDLQRERRLPLGDCLLLLGAASPDQVFTALRLQRKLAGKEQRATTGSARRTDRVRPTDRSGSTRTDKRDPHRTYRMAERAYFGEVLLGTGWITREQLTIAMQRHNLEGIRLGQALVELGFLSEEDLERALELQRSLQRIASEKKPPKH